MENFNTCSLYRVQLCLKPDFDASSFDGHYLLDFDSDRNCFVFVTDYVKFSKYIELNLGVYVFVKSILHISDKTLVYEG